MSNLPAPADMEGVDLWGDTVAFQGVVTSRWFEAITDMYKLARAARLHSLRGKYVKRFDERGIHPFSEACGRAAACIELVPDLMADFDARELERAGVEDAEVEFRREVVLGAVVSGEWAEVEQSVSVKRAA